MRFVLVSRTGDRRFHLGDGAPLVVGRELTCELPILDSGVSRRHAEIRPDEQGISLSDLGSRNGTWINGTRISQARARVGDSVAFGALVFTVEADPGRQDHTEGNGAFVAAASPVATSVPQVIVERRVASPNTALLEVVGQRFAKLVLLAQRLGGLTSVEQLLPIIVDDLFAAFDADRVAVLLRNSDGELVTRLARDAYGGNAERSVSRTITDGVASRRIALLTHDALEDSRTAGESVMRQAIRSAMAAPLLGDGNETCGVVYVDNVRNAQAFSDEDLHFLIAFAGIAAAAVERESSITRLRHAQHVRENFERYFTPQLAERIAASSETMAPGGVRKEVVVLFSDIRGFTAIAETLPPVQLATQLNEYFTAMVDCVFAHEGALDKFIGDAVLAYWGAPESRHDDVDRAVQAALDMQRAVHALNDRWRRQGRPELQIGIGVHSGEAFVGNIGSPRRLEYTLIGDTVNMANRLCDVARAAELLVSDAVRSQMSTHIGLEARPALVSKGRVHDGVGVWSVPVT